jgi:signal peptidase I
MMDLHQIFLFMAILAVGIVSWFYMSVVGSNSMEPALHKGDLVILNYNPHSINRGDIIVYYASWLPNMAVIHRVIAIEKGPQDEIYYITKGDNNKNFDSEPVSPEKVISKVVSIGDIPLLIPRIGYIFLWFQQISIIPNFKWN